MKYTLKISMVFVLFLVLGGIISAKEVKLRVTTENSSLRLKPSSDSAEVYKIQLGTVLISEKKSGEWYFVTVQTKEGNYSLAGYIHELQVEVMGAETKPEIIEPIKEPETIYSQSPKTPSEISAKKFYGKLILGFGQGFSKIKIATKSTGGDLFMEPGGGSAAEIVFGYRMPNNLKIELGIGFQNSGFVADNAKTRFQRIPLKLSLLYEFESQKKLQIYAGAGPVYFLSPNFEWEENGTFWINYDPVFGGHAFVGATTHNPEKPFFFFFEARYMGAFSKYKMNSSNFYPIYKLRLMSAQGIFTNFGIGLFF